AGVCEQRPCACLTRLDRVVGGAGLVEEHDDLSVALKLGGDQERRLLNRKACDALVPLVETRARAESAKQRDALRVERVQLVELVLDRCDVQRLKTGEEPYARGPRL